MRSMLPPVLRTVPAAVAAVLVALLVTLVVAVPALADDERRVERQVDEKVEKVETVVVKKPRVVVRAGDPDDHPYRERDAVVWRSTYLGVEVTPLTPELRRHFGVDDDRGVLLGRVVAGSPAERAGLVVGDVVTAIDDVPVTRQHELGREIRRREAGETVAIDYVRDGRPGRTRAELDEREVRHAFGADFDHDFDFDVDIDVEGLARTGELLRERLEGLEINIDPEAFEALGARLEEMMESEEWQLQMRRIEEIDMRQLEEQMEQLHLRMEELGVELEERGREIEAKGRERRNHPPV